MRQLALLLPGDPNTRTGGYLYDRRIAQGLGTLDRRVRVQRLHDSFPFPDAEALAHAAQVLAALPDGALVLCDGLAFGAMPQLAVAASARLRLAALVHHPLALESGLDAARAAALEHAERAALAAASLVIATSARTAEMLRIRYGVPAARLAVVEPGTERAPPARGSGGSDTVLLCVGTLTPRKGHDLLIDALARIQPARWRLRCAGSLSRDAGWADAIRARIDAAGLGDRVELLGEVDAPTLARCYEQADAFVLPTRLEGYGMALAEALVRGLPVITSAGGAASDTVGDAARCPARTWARWRRHCNGATDHHAACAAQRTLGGGAAARARCRAGASRRSRAAPAGHRVSGFSRAWLALREPADARARDRAASHALLPPLRQHLQGRRIQVLDLGCGAGANLRWLAPRLPTPQHWRLVGHDVDLLAAAANELAHRVDTHTASAAGSTHASCAGAALAFACERRDLAQGLPDLHEVDLVTAAALLDLVSRAWLDDLVAACAARRSALLLALSYVGRIAFAPRHRDDARVRDPAGTMRACAIPLVLTAMAVPVSVGGLGLREASAAAVWHALGLAASDGAAAALIYGLAMLAGSSPGALVLLFDSAQARP